jgi:hypothetical protein
MMANVTGVIGAGLGTIAQAKGTAPSSFCRIKATVKASEGLNVGHGNDLAVGSVEVVS